MPTIGIHFSLYNVSKILRYYILFSPVPSIITADTCRNDIALLN